MDALIPSGKISNWIFKVIKIEQVEDGSAAVVLSLQCKSFVGSGQVHTKSSWLKKSYKEFNNIVKPNGINIDYNIDIEWAKTNLKNTVIQGGLDPKILLKSEKEMIEGATKYIKTFKDIPYVFNLGHGLLPETDPDRVKKLIEFYRNFK